MRGFPVALLPIRRYVAHNATEGSMRRTPAPGPRGVLEVDWPFFGEICRALALRVARDYQPEIVLGVAKAGVIPGVVVASILQSEFSSMTVTRMKDGAAPVLVTGPPPTIRGRRVLVVDETCDTGSTMKLALNEVRALQPAEVRTAENRIHDDSEQNGPGSQVLKVPHAGPPVWFRSPRLPTPAASAASAARPSELDR